MLFLIFSLIPETIALSTDPGQTRLRAQDTSITKIDLKALFYKYFKLGDKMLKRKISLKGDQLVDFYNKLIFEGAYRKGISLNELKEEMEVRGLAPTLFSEKVFLSELINFIEQKSKISLTVKDAKNGLNQCIKNKILFKKGNIISKKLYKDFEKSMKGEPFDIKISRLKNEDVDTGGSLIQCHYCDNQVKLAGKNVQKEYVCKHCSKEFLAITGIVRRREGSFTRAVSFGSPPFVIWIRTENREMSIAFRTDYRFDANSGDRITFIFTKGMFIKNYNLNSILNWNTRTRNIIKASEVSIN